MAVFPKDRPAAIAALDGAIEVVPLIYPAHRGGGRLLVVEIVNGFSQRDSAEQGEGTIEDTAIVWSRNYEVANAGDGGRLEPIGVVAEVGWESELRQGLAEAGESADQQGRFGGHAVVDAQGAPE